MFANILSRYWWMTMLRGVLWIVFGVAIFVRPDISLVSLTLLFGSFALVDGVISAWNSLAGRQENEDWWLLLFAGLAGIIVGVLTFRDPAATALALQFYIAIWAIAVGTLQLVAAMRLRREVDGELWLALSGLASIAFGVFLFAQPAAGALVVLWLIGGYAIVFGVLLIALALNARDFEDQLTNAGGARTV